MRGFNIVKIRRLDAERDMDKYLYVVHQADRCPRTAAELRERPRLAGLDGLDAFRRCLVGEVEGRNVAAATLLHEGTAPGPMVFSRRALR
jgi:hypothetical protein